MKLVKMVSELSREEIITAILDQESANANVTFNDKRGKPVFKLKDKNSKITVTCEMVGGPSKDNGFFVGTYFKGRIVDLGDRRVLRGVITTAPIYHSALLAIMAFFVYRCISLGAFNPIPIIALLFSLWMFKNEFAKQGLIYRYLGRAVFRAVEKKKAR